LKKRKRKVADTSSSKKGKTQSKASKDAKAPNEPSATSKAVENEKLIQDDVEDDDKMVQDDDMAADDMPYDDVAPMQDMSKYFNQDEVDLVMFDDLMGSTIDFTKFAKNILKKDEITKFDLEGPAFKLLKGNYRNYIELEYNMEQCYLALTYQIDWVNSKGDRCPYDLSKPLPFQGPPSRTTIPVDFFFNKDLEYLKTRNT
nr:hypothetical protein [Tanacetum cinerariifolium]